MRDFYLPLHMMWNMISGLKQPDQLKQLVSLWKIKIIMYEMYFKTLATNISEMEITLVK